ncbi:MAG: glutamyl-tRNA reductase [Acidobacteria bacterium]|nr:glutamyl-tRNA reductase [Acidobacteriota bacterium]
MDRERTLGILQTFHVIGTSYPQTPVEVRERLAVGPDQTGPTAQLLVEKAGIAEAVVFSTRQRSEFYFLGPKPTDSSTLDPFWSSTFGIEPAHFRPFLYCLSGEEAVQHLFRMAAGLSSLIVGESHVRQMVADSLASCVTHGAAGPTLQGVFEGALQCARRVGRETRLGRRNLSLGQAVVEMVEKIFGPLDGRIVLLLGAGQTCQMAARDLQRVSAESIYVASPEEREARDIVAKLGHNGAVVAWDNLREAISQADVVIHASRVGRPILSRSDYERIRAARQKRPLFLLDLTVPRGIEPALNSYGEVFLYNVDDMAIIPSCYSRRYESEITAAEALVQAEADQFLSRFQEDPLSGTLVALEQQLERIRQEQLTKSRSALRNLTSEQQQDVERLTSAITRKIFHEVAHELKQSPAEADRGKLSEAVSLMLGLL